MKTLKLLFFSLCLCTYIIEGSPISSPPILEDNPVRIRVYAFCDMTIPIGIGTPVQWFNLSLDFITPYTVLYMEQMEYKNYSEADPPFYNRKIFQPNLSSTFQNYSKNFSNPVEGDGYLAADRATFPFAFNYTSQMDLMLLTKIGWILKFGAIGLPDDGSLGLAPMAINPYGIRSFMGWLKGNNNKSSAIITFYFNNFNSDDPDENKQKSYAIIGFGEESTLSSMCFGTKWFHSQSLAIPNIWSLVAKSVVIDGGKGKGKNRKSRKSTNIVLARNQILMVQPNNQFKTIIPMAQMKILAKVLGASDADFRRIYQLPCNSTKFAPNIKFLFADSAGQEMLIEFAPKEYILPSSFSDDCQLIFTHDDMPKSTTYWIGYSFFQRYCLQLKYIDDNNTSVGLTPKKI